MSDTKRAHDKDTTKRADTRTPGERGTELRDSPMMAHLLDALESGQDVGHYGRLTFVIVARFFMSDDEMLKLLAKQPDHDEREMRTLIEQVRERDYNPPTRERILEWQAHQDFAICPWPDDPAACNIYRELVLPDGIYDNIQEFHEERAEAEEQPQA
jgi:hypothetical protein